MIKVHNVKHTRAAQVKELLARMRQVEADAMNDKTYGPSVEVASIKKNSIDQIRVSVDEYHAKGKIYKYAHMRIWTEKHDSKEMIPTRKGLTVPFTALAEVITALQKIEKSAKRKGYL